MRYAVTKNSLPGLVAAALIAIAVTPHMAQVIRQEKQAKQSIGVPVAPLGDGPFVFDTAEQHNIRVTIVTKVLVHPWSLAFLPDGSMLVTERPGRLRIVRDGKLDPHPVSGVPQVLAIPLAGLMV